MIDPIVDEVRRYRAEHARRFNFDLRAICADIQKIEATWGHTVVSLPPQMLDVAIDPLERSDQRLRYTIRAWPLFIPFPPFLTTANTIRWSVAGESWKSTGMAPS